LQPLKEIDDSYKTSDPWGYQKSPEDARRKAKIIEAAQSCFEESLPPRRTLDIGAGEGWITKDLPGRELFAFECSDNAAARLPSNVKRVLDPVGAGEKFDLVVATGIMYGHYDIRKFLDIIQNCASNMIVTSNIASWEAQDWWAGLDLMKIAEETFPYNEHLQKLRIFKKW
jgi:hypothetical protein